MAGQGSALDFLTDLQDVGQDPGLPAHCQKEPKGLMWPDGTMYSRMPKEKENARRCGACDCHSTIKSGVVALSFWRSPAPPLRVSFSHTWQQTAGGEACDPNMQGRALVTSVQRGSVERSLLCRSAELLL
ncbi:hypothetical protein CB1_001984024 [Camelus ferus]|nr:hypothetical protein CB1_001984024 [Camelus ferus]